MMVAAYPMPNLHAQALKRAVVIVGGVDVLALELGVHEDLLGQYLRGESPVPGELFLKATEIITAASVLDAAKANREPVPQGK
ncbi:MAG TPA: hypothetical protein VGP97_10005 [Burkholderiales bacterium]|jgi:DNA-binding transcriptional regulator YdaS (Cro superfamily)|nr:hypothetical protein [Burkholderiales bacterium]